MTTNFNSKKIFVKDAKFSSFTIKGNRKVEKQIEDTIKQQEEILRLKEVDKEKLKMVVQY